MDEQKIRKIVQDEIDKNHYDGQYSYTRIDKHYHNNVDSPSIPTINLNWISPTVPTTNTSGFYFMPTCAGAPTGTPIAGKGAFIYDTTNNKLYVYNGSAWKSVALL